MKQKEVAEKIQWHPGFCGGLELELRDYRDILEFEPEHYLSKEPIRMDMLVIKKKSDIKIDNPIAEIFREHNVIEYKSPQDSLSVDSLYKTIGYACLYKGLGQTVGEISESELTVSVFRHSYPRKLFEALKKMDVRIDKPSPGVYRIRQLINLPVQIVVTKELKRGEHSALKILTDNADEYEIRRFIRETESYIMPVDRQNADAVLQVSVSSNMELYERIRKESNMCDALYNLMKEEIDAKVAKEVSEGEARGEARGKAIGEARGEAIGEARGKAIGEARGVNKLKEAILAIKEGVNSAEIAEKYGKEVFDTAESVLKSIM